MLFNIAEIRKLLLLLKLQCISLMTNHYKMHYNRTETLPLQFQASPAETRTGCATKRFKREHSLPLLQRISSVMKKCFRQDCFQMALPVECAWVVSNRRRSIAGKPLQDAAKTLPVKKKESKIVQNSNIPLSLAREKRAC